MLYLTQAPALPNSNSHPATFLPFPIHWCPPKSNALDVDSILFPDFISHPLLTQRLSRGCSGRGRGTNLAHSTEDARAGEDSCILPSPALISPASFLSSWLPSRACPGLWPCLTSLLEHFTAPLWALRGLVCTSAVFAAVKPHSLGSSLI